MKILVTGATVGTLDCLAAFLDGWVSSRITPQRTLKYIASAALGRNALLGDWTAVIFGLLFHYLITLTFTYFFFLVYPFVSKRIKKPLLLGIVYGLFTWMVMRFLVLPMTKLHLPPPELKKSIKAALILIFAMGIPLALLISRPRQ